MDGAAARSHLEEKYLRIKNQDKHPVSPHVDQLVDLAACVDEFLSNVRVTFVDGQVDGQVVAVEHQRVQLGTAGL